MEDLQIKLRDFDLVSKSNYFVSVNKDGKIIDGFSNEDIEEKEKYMDCIVVSVHVFDEDTMSVNIVL